MRATIEIGGEEATLEGWEWSSEDEELKEMLNRMLDVDGPSGADPAPSYHEAKRVIGIVGGKIVDYELPEYEEGHVY